VAGFEGYQVENIQVLKQKLGTSDTAVVRAAVDLLAFCNGLRVQTDPSIFLNNYLVNLQNGGTTHER
jgi:hypothetical protein